MTIEQIISETKKAGSHFFDADTMRFFASRVWRAVHKGPGGIFFITSEQFRPMSGNPHPRLYTVRQFFGARAPKDGGAIDTVGEFQAYDDSRKALRAAARLARGGKL
jgi:hypothetical protein